MNFYGNWGGWLVRRKLVPSAAGGLLMKTRSGACIASLVNHCKLPESIKPGKKHLEKGNVNCFQRGAKQHSQSKSWVGKNTRLRLDRCIPISSDTRSNSQYHNMQYTIHKRQFLICNMQYTVLNTQYSIHNTQYTILNTQYAITVHFLFPLTLSRLVSPLLTIHNTCLLQLVQSLVEHITEHSRVQQQGMDIAV